VIALLEYLYLAIILKKLGGVLEGQEPSLTSLVSAPGTNYPNGNYKTGTNYPRWKY